MRTDLSRPFTLEAIQSSWPAESKIKAVILFGSRAAGNLSPAEEESADWDIGVIYTGDCPELEFPPNWDMFLWELDHWERGFVLQIEIARSVQVLYDPEGLVEERLAFLREKILPHWAGYLHRF